MVSKTVLFVFLSLILLKPSAAQQSSVSNYNLRWTTPGINSKGSMPVGNGDIGANVWVEANGDLVFYISKTDAWSEIGRLLKLGRVRVSMTPNPFKGSGFLQELKLEEGAVAIDYGSAKVKFWIDAHNPVIQTEIKSSIPVAVKVTYENWRKESRPITGAEAGSVWGMGVRQVSKDCQVDISQEPDVVLANDQKSIISYHRNPYSIWKGNLQVQALYDFDNYRPDPLLHANFGVLIRGAGLKNQDDTTLVSTGAARQFSIAVYPAGRQGPVDAWVRQLRQQAAVIEAVPVQKRALAHRQWWKNFWNRSYIYITAKDSVQREQAFIVSRGYILQRFINACGGRGGSPIKFNGSIFTVDTYETGGPQKDLDADFRLWGGCYWWQNTRLPYWSMLESGDFDLFAPLFKMYMNALPLRMAATRKYYGHEGAFFPETMNFWGTYADGDYGCKRDSLPDGFVKNPYIRYYWQSGLELALMMADYYRFTNSSSFAKDTLLPFASQILKFYAQHWKKGPDGKILFDPAMSLETFHTAVNPLPEIVGIRVVTEKLLKLPNLTGKQKEEWTALIQALPAVPLRLKGTDTLLAPAQAYSNKANIENPELYAVFPYRAYAVGKPGLDLAIRTFNARTHKENGGWQQNSIQAAYLGLTREAKAMVVESFSRWNKEMRFPAFWGPNYDWTPDQCHGSVAVTALQRMLLQYEDDKVTLLPAWPAEWDVQFRLAGPGGKNYEGVVKNGKLKVNPKKS
ncbi:DUF5703 domain-containing protein [Niabella hirudinis]|uniref:DUF5703 domain-containing protein n=1 Tax=Niabella hirudinis TaxID=1285929 RepID=UPI003EC050E8